MNIQQLRQSVKIKWLSYYEQNRSWLVKIRVWGTYNGLRRPSSGFILATLSVLEPQFDKTISFILDLNDNPDQIVTALGLNFNPDEELRLITSELSNTTTQFANEPVQENYPESKPVPLVAVAAQSSSGETLSSPLPRLQQPVSAFTENTERMYTLTDVPLATVATINPQTFSKTITADLPRLQKPVSASTENAEIIPTEKAVSSVAVATKVASSTSAKSASSLLLQDQPVRLPLAITINVLNKAKTPPSRKVKDSRFCHVPIKFSTLLLKTNCLTGILFLRDCLKSSVSGNGNQGKKPQKPKDVPRKVNPSPRKNASRLASWVDEFCQGSGYDSEAAISIQL